MKQLLLVTINIKKQHIDVDSFVALCIVRGNGKIKHHRNRHLRAKSHNLKNLEVLGSFVVLNWICTKLCE